MRELDPEIRRYQAEQVVSFRKTTEPFGGLSNMAPGYPIVVGQVRARTTEALYQVARFPENVELQLRILAQASPMTAKMVSKPFRHLTRTDWDFARVRVMRWCLKLKLTQHWDSFGELLDQTGSRDIVENSRKDPFWGAVPSGAELVGQNVLGRLLMELRTNKARGRESMLPVKPPSIQSFFLLGKPVPAVDHRGTPVQWFGGSMSGDGGTRVIESAIVDSRQRIYQVVAAEIVRHLAEPQGAAQLAAHLGVSPSQMRSWLKEFEAHGIVTKHRSLYGLPKGSPAQLTLLKDQLQETVPESLFGEKSL